MDLTDSVGGDGLSDEGATSELVVTARPGADTSAVASLISSQGAAVREELKQLSASLVEVERTRAQDVKRALTGSPLVESVEDNHVYEAQQTPSDPVYSTQWSLQTIHAAEAWTLTTGSPDVTVAVVDTGVEAVHPDLAARLLPGVNAHDHTTDCSDVTGHGTAVAGVLGAVADNGIGITPVMWQGAILPVRVTDSRGRATSWSIAAGIRAAMDYNARVANISFGPLHEDRIVMGQARLAWLAGCMVIAAAGNTGVDTTGGSSGDILFVGATERSDHLAAFSTRGDFVDLVAPGVEIQTTRVGGAYGTMSGTSIAAPLVSSTAALIWALKPELRPGTVRDLLLASALDLGDPGRDRSYGAGRLDVGLALGMASTILEAQDVTPPVIQITSPTNGEALDSPFTMSVEATDDVGPPSLTLQLDSHQLAEDEVPPYTFVVDPSLYAPGPHRLSVVAADLSGNLAEATIGIVFQGVGDVIPPSGAFVSPSGGADVWGLVTLIANVTDDQALDHAEVLVDGALLETIPLLSQASARVAYNWNISGSSIVAGVHRVTIRVYDVAGNASDISQTLSVLR